MKLLTLLICSTMAFSTAWADKDPGQQDRDQKGDQGRWQDGDDKDKDDSSPLPPDQAFYLNGKWHLVQQTCSSGAPVRSGFVFGRDFLELTFTDFDFTSDSDIAHCSTWSSGVYELNDGILRMTVDRSRSTCGPGERLTTFSYPMRIFNSTQFGIRMGPLNGGPCPHGDILENVYERAD